MALIFMVAVVSILVLYKLNEILDSRLPQETEKGEDETSPSVSVDECSYPTEEIVPLRTRHSHTLSQREGGEAVEHRARDRPLDDLKKDYQTWVQNIRDYDRMRSILN